MAVNAELIGPCPECGNHFNSYQGFHALSGGQMVKCMHCDFTAIGTDRAKAIEQWNACGQRKKENAVGLAPCPVCCSTAIEHDLPDEGRAWIKCNVCDTTVFGNTDAEAIKYWLTSPPYAALLSARITLKRKGLRGLSSMLKFVMNTQYKKSEVEGRAANRWMAPELGIPFETSPEPISTIKITMTATRPDGTTITATEHTTDHESLHHSASQLARKFNNLYSA